MEIRFAEIRDSPGMIDLLQQVGEVHHQIRPDLFRGGAQKYDEKALEEILQEYEICSGEHVFYTGTSPDYQWLLPYFYYKQEVTLKVSLPLSHLGSIRSVTLIITAQRTFLVVQLFRSCPPMQGTQVWSLVQEVSICQRAVEPTHHNY